MPLDEALHALPALPRDQDGPVFNEPWEAEAFALAVHLSEAGHFTWPEWVEVFSQEIAAAQVQGDPDVGNTYYGRPEDIRSQIQRRKDNNIKAGKWVLICGTQYYHHWLKALERLCVAKGLVEPQAMQQRREAWYRAYLNTPHGQPVELSAATEPEEG